MTTHPQNASAPAHWSYQGERILFNGLCVAMSQNKSDTIADTMNSHARLTEQNAALVKALEQAEGTAVNLHCALQGTACMDPNDSRIAVITGQVVRDLLVMRNEVAAALAQHRTP